MNSYRNVLSFKDMLEYHDDCNPSGIYYHYTSVDAFKSIMESMQLRLTRYDRMTKGDDEGKEAVRVAIDILEGLEEEKVITHSLCEKVVATIQSDMDESFTRFYLECGKRVPCIPYVICFTQIEIGDGGDSEWISGRELRMEVRPDFDFLEMMSGSRICNVSFDPKGFYVFRKVDYGKESIRNRLKDEIRDYLYQNSEQSDDYICIDIRNIVNEERMFLHSADYSYQKEARIVIYVPSDHDAIPGIDDVVKTKRVMSASKDWEYLPYDSDSGHIYLNLKVPLRTMTVKTLDTDSKDVECRVKAILDKAVKDGFIKYIG